MEFSAISNSQTCVKVQSMQIQPLEQLHWVLACVRFKRIKRFVNKRKTQHSLILEKEQLILKN